MASDTALLARKEIEFARHEMLEALDGRLKAAGAMAVTGGLAGPRGPLADQMPRR